MRNLILFLAVAATALTGFMATADADQRLTLKQERLLGQPNRFTVEVKDFPTDGELTRDSLQALVERQVERAGLKLLPENAEPPLAKIIVTITSEMQEDTSILYFADVNVYNTTTIQTEYNIRQGTVWKLGAYKVRPHKSFPRNVEGKVYRMVKYFIYDYYTANPYLKPAALEEEGY